MPSVTIRPISFRGVDSRPKAMASVLCPSVKSWDTGKKISAWVGTIYCNACPAARELHINYTLSTGEVHCAAE